MKKLSLYPLQLTNYPETRVKVDMMEPMAGTSMNLGQVSTAMGTGVSAGDALGSASAASVAASEAGT